MNEEKTTGEDFTNRCGGCKFFHELHEWDLEADRIALDELQEGGCLGEGECLRFPPVPVPGGKAPGSYRGEFLWMQPLVWKGGWCGEHKPKGGAV